MKPDRGSLFGGTRLTITGKGFAVPHAVIKVKVGSVSCNVEEFSDSWIRCMIEYTAKTYDITNPGIHPGKIAIFLPFHSLIIHMIPLQFL